MNREETVPLVPFQNNRSSCLLGFGAQTTSSIVPSEKVSPVVTTVPFFVLWFLRAVASISLTCQPHFVRFAELSRKAAETPRPDRRGRAQTHFPPHELMQSPLPQVAKRSAAKNVQFWYEFFGCKLILGLIIGNNCVTGTHS